MVQTQDRTGVVIRSVLVPVEDLTPERRDELRSQTIATLEAKAKEMLTGNRRLVTRDLRPSDLGLTNDEWNETASTTGNAFQDSVIAAGSTYTVGDETFVAIMGLADHSPYPILSALRFTIGGQIQRIVDLNSLVGVVQKRAFFLSPIIITQNVAIKIEHYPRGISGVTGAMGTVDIAYLGFVTEVAGKNLNV